MQTSSFFLLSFYHPAPTTSHFHLPSFYANYIVDDGRQITTALLLIVLAVLALQHQEIQHQIRQSSLLFDLVALVEEALHLVSACVFQA